MDESLFGPPAANYWLENAKEMQELILEKQFGLIEWKK